MSGDELIPSASRLVRSLRDLGYDFAQAIADIVDNSIEAEAKRIDIDIRFDGDDSWVRIADDGVGMNPSELREALRYGANRSYGDEDLGKFGLGLKTASLSQSQRLTVASRSSKIRANVAAYAWDLEHITKSDKWNLLPVEECGPQSSLGAALAKSTGTVVLWERLDRILGYKHPYGEAARRRLSTMCRETEEHLAMVFHKFLSGEVPGKRLAIYINGNRVAPWDPFCRDNSKTQKLDEIKFSIDYEGKRGSVVLEPYVLPRQDEFESVSAFNNASGPLGWNQQQGFYFYRSKRLIQSGGWSNLRAPDEHTKYARVAVRFSSNLDEAFKINVAKMRVQLPSAIRDDVRAALKSVVKVARQRYDNKTASAIATLGINERKSNKKYAEKKLTIDEWMRRTMLVTNPEERPTVAAVLQRLRDA